MSKFERWELIYGVQKGIEDLYQHSNYINKEELNVLIESLEKMKTLKENITNQEKDLKLRLLISSRERNVYLEKLRKVEEFCENKNWTGSDHQDGSFFTKLNDLLYNDNPQNSNIAGSVGVVVNKEKEEGK